MSIPWAGRSLRIILFVFVAPSHRIPFDYIVVGLILDPPPDFYFIIFRETLRTVV